MSAVPFSQPYFGPEEEAAVTEVIRSGWVVGGPRLAEFERSFAHQCGVEHAIGISSWTTGAFLILKSLGIGPGDEVIVPSLTFIASVNVISHVGATPVFADIDPRTYNIDPEDIEHRITPRTRAILPVDQIGLPCEIDRVNAIAQRHGVRVIQDAACSFGSRFRGRPVGALAPITIFSLHARKVITTGEGGMIVTSDAELAARLRRQRHQGMSLTDFERHSATPTTFETYPEVGYNFRITDIQAAIGLVQLSRLPKIMDMRRLVAEYYRHALSNSPHIEVPYIADYITPNWQSFQVRVREGGPLSRNDVMTRLHAEGISTRRGVMASHLEPPYRDRVKLPHTEAAARQCVQLPMYTGLGQEDVDRVLASLNRIFHN